MPGEPGPPPPPPRPAGLLESPERRLTKERAAREQAVAKFFDKLTEALEIGRHFLHEMAERELAEDAANRRRREERQRAMHQRQMGR